jgi:hypothetical protein
MGLPTFVSIRNLPSEREEQRAVLASPEIERVLCFALGPDGTNNISQACFKWIARMGIGQKSEVVMCVTPEIALERSRELTDETVLGIFWTCAVYDREKDLFFGNPDTFPFYFQETMPLDEMQLATRPELVHPGGGLISGPSWRIASHPSPEGLLKSLRCEIVRALSNADAAILCASGVAEACITTESARAKQGLTTLHVFGSPEMVFFGGITEEGAALIQRVHERMSRVSAGQ